MMFWILVWKCHFLLLVPILSFGVNLKLWFIVCIFIFSLVMNCFGFVVSIFIFILAICLNSHSDSGFYFLYILIGFLWIWILWWNYFNWKFGLFAIRWKFMKILIHLFLVMWKTLNSMIGKKKTPITWLLKTASTPKLLKNWEG